MKKSKTLHRFAAVAAVLLTLCLVFVAPVGAAEVTCQGPCEHVAAIGTTHYDTLQDAVNAATTGTATALVEIKLLQDGGEVSGPGIVVGGTQNGYGVTTKNGKQHIKIDFNRCTYNVTSLVGSEKSVTNCFQLHSESTVYLTNGGIKVSETVKSSDPMSKYSASYSAHDQPKGSAMIIQNYADLTLENMILDGSGLSFEGGENYVLSNNCGKVNIIGNTKITAKDCDYAFDSCKYESYDSPVVTVSAGTITGKVEVTGGSLVINGGTFTDPTVLNYLDDSADVTVTLKNNVQVSETITVSKGKATLDLGTKTLSADEGLTFTRQQKTGQIIYVKGGELTILNGKIERDSGLIDVDGGKLTLEDKAELKAINGQAINIYGSTDSTVDEFSVVNINGGASISGDYAIIVRDWTEGEIKDVSYGTKLNINGGTISGNDGIWVMGNIKHDGNIPKITITDGIISCTEVALAGMGNAIWDIDGGSFSGADVMNIKAGTYDISGGSFTASGAYVETPASHDNGIEPVGATVGILGNSGYAKNVALTISGGEFSSTNGHALFEGINSEAMGSALETTGQIQITGGKFLTSAQNLDAVKITNTEKSSISGGVFNTPVNADYIAEGNAAVYNNGEDYATYPYAVVNADDVSVSIYTNPIEFSIYSDVTGSHEITINNIGNLPVTVTGITISPETEKLTNTTVVSHELPVKGSTTFTLSWDKLPAGEYTVTISAKAVDGEQTTSTTIPVKVTEREPVTPPEDDNEGDEDEGTTTQPTERPSTGGATDTGSGNFAEYPRQADGTAGEISFGSSKDVKAVDLPEGVTGEVKLIAKSTHPAPEGKDTHKVFEINIPNYPTGKAATIKFEMTLADIEAKGLTAADVCLYHFNKETGLWEKLPTTFKVVDGKVYFEAVTTGFSPFAIVFEKGAATPAAGADEPVTPPTETPDVPETPGTLPPVDTPETPEQPTESPAPILAVLAGLGAAVVLRRK